MNECVTSVNKIETEQNKSYGATKKLHISLALTATIVAGVTGSVLSLNTSRVSAENPRVSLGASSILSNTNAVSFSGEMIAPPENFLFSSGSIQFIKINDDNPGDIQQYLLINDADPSQIGFNAGNINAIPTSYNPVAVTNTVEYAIATSIRNAVTASRYGDIIGIVNAYNPTDKSKEENASGGVAMTNILSNTNAQNIAGEITPGSQMLIDSQITLDSVSYQNATNAGSADRSQVLVNEGGIIIDNIITFNPSTNTVESAITFSIDTARSQSRYGDIIGITNVYKGPGQQPFKNPRGSIAFGNILSNTNSLNTALELINIKGTSFDEVTGNISYTNASSFVTGFDSSQILIRNALYNMNGDIDLDLPNLSVEKAIADSINQANNSSRFGDVIGIVKAYQGSWDNGYNNPRTSVAITNVLSNLDSQNFVGEMVAPKDNFDFSFNIQATANYTLAGNGDSSQLVINFATISGETFGPYNNPFLIDNTVERATSRAIEQANSSGRIGDLIGITKAWQSNGRSSLD